MKDEKCSRALYTCSGTHRKALARGVVNTFILSSQNPDTVPDTFYRTLFYYTMAGGGTGKSPVRVQALGERFMLYLEMCLYGIQF